MWTRAFWKATAERCLRGAAVAVIGTFFVGDKLFEAFNVNTWQDVGSLAVGGAFGSLLFALAGNTVNGGHGPAFTSAENVVE